MFLLLDIGGTNTRLATATNPESFITLEKFSTPPTFSATLSALASTLDQLKLTAIDSTIIGLPGIIDSTTEKLIYSPNLPGWIGQLIRQPLEKITGSPVRIVNDSALAGLGEACHGTGQGFDIVAYLTISTGVGGARIVNKKIDSFTHGFEPGSQIIDASGHLCPDCHHPSSLENLVGGASVSRRYGCHPKEIKDPAVWASLAKWLAFGLNNITALWSPSIIVLGGPMMRDIPLDQVISHTTSLTTFLPQPPIIKSAALGDDRAFYGALTLLSDTKKNSLT